MLRIFVAIGQRTNGTYKVIVFPEDDSSGNHHRGVHLKQGERVNWSVRNMTDRKLKVRIGDFRVKGKKASPVDFLDREDNVGKAGHTIGSVGLKQLSAKAKLTGIYDYDIEAWIGGKWKSIKDPKLRIDGKGKKKKRRKK